MNGSSKSQKTRRISDAAVEAKTGKDWRQWFAILDEGGAQSMSHREIARYLREEQKVPAWWSQMVANVYEQDLGTREKHQMPEGYQISVSVTLDASIDSVYRCWKEDDIRGRWLTGENIAVRKATPSKSMRITWSDGRTSVDVNFYSKGDSRSQVVVQHSKLADVERAEMMKLYWREALVRLKGVL